MARDKKVVRLRRRSSFNMGTIIFIILFIYIAFNVIIYLTKDQLAICEVHEGSNVNTEIITGLVLRDEEVFYANQAGYVTYFQKEGARVAKGAPVYSIDENRDFMDVVASGDVTLKITNDIHSEMKHDINLFRNTFSNDKFDYVYKFKDNVQNTAFNLLNSTLLEEGTAIYDETGIDYTYSGIPSKGSGIVSYYIDNYEGVTTDSITMDLFQLDNYERKGLRTTEMAAINNPIYKIVNSDNWSIILPVNEDQYRVLSDKKQVIGTIMKDSMKIQMKSKVFQKGTDYFVELSMKQYMSNYIEDRFLDIEIDFGGIDGLKIPQTAITEKEFYLVPFDFFVSGGNTDTDGLTVGSYSKTGEITFVYETVKIYYKDDSYGYVDASQFDVGTLIYSSNNKEFTLNQVGSLKGVYNVNSGYAIFRRIDIIYEDKDYCVIAKNTTYGLSAFDQIALDANLAIEQNIIY